MLDFILSLFFFVYVGSDPSSSHPLFTGHAKSFAPQETSEEGEKRGKHE